jgi:hypothetical protein
VRHGAWVLLLLIAVGCSDDEPACVGICSAPPGAPSFDGATSLAPDGTGQRLQVTWAPGRDDTTPPERLRYKIYLSRYSGRATTRPAVLTTEPGVTSSYVSVSDPSGLYYAVVHAVDEQGNEDANRAERSANAFADNQAPTFGGAKTATPRPGTAVALTWDPASDGPGTPAAGIRYNAYAVDAAGGTTWLGTTIGATEIVVPGGASGVRRRYLVRAVDAAGNMDANQVTLEAESGTDARPPTFAGCEAVDVLGSRAVRVRWQRATDESTPQSAIRYEVFASQSPGAEDFAKPAATAVGAAEVVVTGLPASTTSHFVCRARDAAGNTETNTVEKSARTTDNVTPPTFAGATGTVRGVAREASLTWAAASDDTTAAANIVYVVYLAVGTDPFDFKAPFAVSDAGATSLVVKDLPSRSSLRLVVRARDADYNEDANAIETTGTTSVSFSRDIIPFFGRNCAVVGCHTGSVIGHGVAFSLAAYEAYGNIWNVTTGQNFTPPGGSPVSPRYKRINPGDPNTSYLYLKITGTPGITPDPMPAPGTGTILDASEIGMVRSWITDGAEKN